MDKRFINSKNRVPPVSKSPGMNCGNENEKKNTGDISL